MKTMKLTKEDFNEIDWAIEFAYNLFLDKIGIKNTRDLYKLHTKIHIYNIEIQNWDENSEIILMENPF